MSRHPVFTLPAGLLVLLLAAAPAAAQSCLGIPTRDGAIAVVGTYGTRGGSAELGGEFHADVTGPAAFGFAYRTSPDDGPSTWDARAAYDLFLLEPAVCPVVGVRYIDPAAAGAEGRLGVPLGIGIAKTMDAGPLATTVYAVPQYVWFEDGSEFMAEAGLALRLLPLFLRAAIALDTATDEPGVRLGVGLVF